MTNSETDPMRLTPLAQAACIAMSTLAMPATAMICSACPALDMLVRMYAAGVTPVVVTGNGMADPVPVEDHGLRVLGLDIVDPTLGWAMLMVVARIEDSREEACGIVAAQESAGFSGLYFDTLVLHAPATSQIMLGIDVQRTETPTGSALVTRRLEIGVDQRTGRITAAERA